MAFLLGLIATLVVTPLVIRLSPTLGLIDRPGDDPLKVHHRATPRSGGIAVALGLLAGGFAVGSPAVALVLGGAAALALGLADDRQALPPKLRLWIEAVLALVVSWMLIRQGDLLLIALGALVIVVAINAANLYDGLDGLLPSAAAMTAVGLAALGGRLSSWLWVLAGVLVGFFFYNRPPARIFLGDGGAYLAGTILGLALVDGATGARSYLGGVLAFGLIGIDFLYTLFRRFQAGVPLFIGDRRHLYDQLADRGWSVLRIVSVLGLIHAALVAIGIWLANAS